MSQNDFTIANQSFPAFRADLNSALQALASNNSGTSAPSTTFANMWWYDSSNNILYIRNEDNDAWIQFATLDQTNDLFVVTSSIDVGDNVKALFGDSDDLQIYHDSSNSIIKDAGTGRLQLLSNRLDINKSDGSEGMATFIEDAQVILYYDNEVKFQTTSTGIDITDSSNAELKLQTDNANGGSVVKFNRSGTDYSYIGTKGYFLGNSDNNLYLRANSGLGIQFYTNGNNQRMSIDSSGNVLVGQTSQAYGTVGASITQTGQLGATANGDSSLILNRKTSDGTIVQFRKDNTVVGSIGTLSGYLAIGDDVGILFNNANPSISAFNASTNANRDGAINIGASNARFKDLYLSGNVLTSNIYGQNDGNTGIQFEGSDVITIHTGGQQAMQISSNQAVSIGTTANTYALNVGGSGSDKRGLFQGSNQYRLGLQNGTSNLVYLGSGGADNFRISNSAGSTRLEMDASGAVTIPNQPAFQARPSGKLENITPNTSVDLNFATETFDRNADYNAGGSPSTFTAPVTGVYQLNLMAYIENLQVGSTYFQIAIITSNRNYPLVVDPNFNTNLNYYHMTISVLADMDAGDTAYVSAYQSGGSAVTDIDTASYFSGYLVA